MLEAAQRFGYEGVELRIDAEHHHGLERDASSEARRDARNRAASAGIAICCVATSCRFADPAAADGHVHDGREAIALAADLGAPRLRVFGGPIPDGMDRVAAVEQVARGLGALTEEARRRDVTVCVETHDDWSDPVDVAALMRRVDHPAIAVNWDIMHPVIFAGRRMDEAFAALRPWIRHVHVHDGGFDDDGKLKMLPIGTGDVDHGRALALLAEMGYDGYISGEWIEWEPWEVHLPRELAAMKALEGK
jgi:sugar phosphate isomerase/epimerase